MLSVETELHLTLTVAAAEVEVNDLAAWCFGVRNEIGQEILAQLLRRAQEQHWERTLEGAAEINCQRCGLVHCGAEARVVRRGSRPRQIRTSSGRVRFALLQLTCLECGATWSPYAELLGLEPRQRVCEELLRKLTDLVTRLSYANTAGLGGQWLGASVTPRTLHRAVQARGPAVEFTEGEGFEVVVADSTCVPAGSVDRGEAACMAFQVEKRSRRRGRSRYRKRVVGFGLGWGCWEEALATRTAPKLAVTDGEMGVHQVVEAYYPKARHQQCEWHVVHSINQSLMLDGMPVRQRRETQAELREIFWKRGSKARARYQAFTDRLAEYPRTHTLLTNASPYVLYEEPSIVRSTSLAEREMREMNRRTDVGVRWSISGIANMLKLRLAQRLNPDDYARVWRAQRPITSYLASHA
jgi:hypothetical protein